MDSSKFEVRLTLWGKQAEQFNTPVGTVIAFKGVRVNDFQGEWILDSEILLTLLSYQGGPCLSRARGPWLSVPIYQRRTL